MKTSISWPAVTGLLAVGVIVIYALIRLPMDNLWDQTRVASQAGDVPSKAAEEPPTRSDFVFPPVEIAVGGETTVAAPTKTAGKVHLPPALPQLDASKKPEQAAEIALTQPTTQPQEADQLLEIAETLLDASADSSPIATQASDTFNDSELLAVNPLATLSESVEAKSESQEILDAPLDLPDLTLATPNTLPIPEELVKSENLSVQDSLALTQPSESPLATSTSDLTPKDIPWPNEEDLPGEGDGDTVANDERDSFPARIHDQISPGAKPLKVQIVSEKSPVDSDAAELQLSDDPAIQERIEERVTEKENSTLELPPGYIARPVQLLRQLDQARDRHPALGVWVIHYQSLIEKLCAAQPGERRRCLEELERHRQQLDGLIRRTVQTGGQKMAAQIPADLKQLGYALDRRLDFWQAIVPGNPILAQRQQQQEKQIHLIRSRRWNFSNVSITPEWSQYLMWPELVQVINDSQLSGEQKQQWAREILTRVNSGMLDFQQEAVIDQLLPIDLRKQLYHHAGIQLDGSEVLEAIEQYEAEGDVLAAMKIMEGYRWLQLSEDVHDQQLVSLIENHYRNANFRLTASREFINRWFVSQTWVNQTIARQKNNPVGIGVMPFELMLVPSEHGFDFQLAPAGSENGSSDGWQPVQPAPTREKSDDSDILAVGFDSEDPPLPPGYLEEISTVGGNYRQIPFCDWMIQRYPRGMTFQAEEVVFRNQAESSSELAQQLNQQLSQRLEQTQQTLERAIRGFQLAGLFPRVVENRTSNDALTARFRIADHTQLASHTARPNPTAHALLSLQIHQSFGNNALSRIGVAGQTFTWGTLQDHLCHVFGIQPQPGQELSALDSLTFAQQRAIELQLERQHVTIRFQLDNARLANLETGPIVILLHYIPLVERCQVALQPDPQGAITVQSGTLSIPQQQRLANYLAQLHADTTVQLTPQDWSEDPLLNQLQISQFELRDGWLSVSIEGLARKGRIGLTAAEGEGETDKDTSQSTHLIQAFLSDDVDTRWMLPAEVAPDPKLGSEAPESQSGGLVSVLEEAPPEERSQKARAVPGRFPAVSTTRPVLRSVLE